MPASSFGGDHGLTVNFDAMHEKGKCPAAPSLPCWLAQRNVAFSNGGRSSNSTFPKGSAGVHQRARPEHSSRILKNSHLLFLPAQWKKAPRRTRDTTPLWPCRSPDLRTTTIAFQVLRAYSRLWKQYTSRAI